MRTALCLLSLLALEIHVNAQSPTPPAQSTRVNIDNFRRAESDNYFAKFVKDAGGIGKFHHEREVADIDHQTVIRLNRDTLYSFGVFDLEAAPVTVTLPNAGKRYMAIQVINEDHYATDVLYAPVTHTFTQAEVGTRYVAFAVRTFVNPNDPADIKAAHALQDSIKIEQKSPGKLEIPAWDQASLKKIRDALLNLAAANGGIDSARMFGRKDQVDPTDHLIGTAAGWGGNPKTAAMYLGAEPKQNDGKTPYVLTIKDVPVDGFWSISVYNKAGFFEKNAQNAYTVNNITAKRESNGSVVVHFGGDEKASNYIPITPGWNYVLRLYRPRAEILNGTWKAPEATPVK